VLALGTRHPTATDDVNTEVARSLGALRMLPCFRARCRAGGWRLGQSTIEREPNCLTANKRNAVIWWRPAAVTAKVGDPNNVERNVVSSRGSRADRGNRLFARAAVRAKARIARTGDALHDA